MKKNLSFFLFVILIAAFFSASGCSRKKDEPADEKKADNGLSPSLTEEMERLSEKQYYLNNVSSLKRLHPAQQSFTIDSSKENTLSGRRGTHLVVPPDSFVDSNGQPVVGRVTVSMVEAMDSVDIMGTDIPMVYRDGSGKTYQFESAGMFKVSARGAGGLRLAKDKKLAVYFPNIRPGDRFNVYRLDGRGQWVYHGHNQETTGPDGTSFREYRIDWLTWWNFDHPSDEVACITGEITGFSLEDIKSCMVRIVGLDKLQVDKGIIEGKIFRINALINSRVKVLIMSNGKLAATSDIITVWERKGDKSGGQCMDVGSVAITTEPADITSNSSFKNDVGISEPLYSSYVKAFEKQRAEAEERRKNRNRPANVPTL